MSLLTIDQNSYKFDTVNSPRSRKALQNLGLVEKDLYYITREQIEKQGIDPQFRDDAEFFIQTKEQHLRQRCDQFLELAKQEREKIIQGERADEQSGRHQTSEMGTSRSSFRLSRLAQKKEDIIRQLKQKQQIEIEKQIMDEVKIEEMHQKHLQKEQKLQQLKEKQLQDQQIKQQEQEIKMKQIEDKIEAARRKQQEENEMILLKQIQDEEHLLRKKQESDLLKLKKKEEQERLRVEKLTNLEKRIEYQEQQKQQDNMQRQMEYERKLQNIKNEAERKQREMQLKNKQTEEQIQQRLEQARGQQAEEIRKVEEKMINLENLNYERRKQKEFDRENQTQIKREKEQLKNQTLIEKKSSLEREKGQKDELYMKNEFDRETRKREQDTVINRQRILMTQHKDRKREEVKLNNIKQSQSLELKRYEFINKKEEIISQAEQNRQQRILAAKRNQISQVLKLEDADLNNIRLKRLEELKNQKRIEKLEEVEGRLKTFQDEQNRMTELKLKLEKQLQQEKEQILNEFQNKKAEYVLNKTVKNQNQSQSSGQVSSHLSYPIQKNKKNNSIQSQGYIKPKTNFIHQQFEYPTNRTAQILQNNSLSPRNVLSQTKTESDAPTFQKYTNKFTPEIKKAVQSNILTTQTTKTIPLYLNIEQKKSELKQQRMLNSQSMKAQRKTSYEVDEKTYMAVQLYQSPKFPEFLVDVKLKKKTKKVINNLFFFPSQIQQKQQKKSNLQI